MPDSPHTLQTPPPPREGPEPIPVLPAEPALASTVAGAAVGAEAEFARALVDPVTGIPGDGTANRLFHVLYTELKRSARAQMRKESAGHTLSATALTHEAWFRLAAQTRMQWASRGHFLAMASVMMRRILVNHAHAKRADKRDGAMVSLTLTEAQHVADGGDMDVVRVHDALLALERIDPRAAKVVELKFFGGMETDEIADVMALSAATVKRDWSLARAWLHRELKG